jgi:hypothetical protein
VDWATGEFDGPATPPVGIELDDDPEAIHRLLGYLDGRQRAHGEPPAACWSRNIAPGDAGLPARQARRSG